MASAQDEYNELFRDKSHRTRHPDDDDDDAASFLESDSDGDNEATPRTSDVENHPPPTSRYQIPSYDRSNSGTTNTGPKGVIADARDHRDGKRSARTSVNASRTSFQSQVQGNGYTNGAPQIPASVGEEHEGSDDGMEDETLDDEYMDRWRMSRLKQLQGSRVGSSGKERRAAQGRYGSIVPVDGEGYLEAVDGSGSVTVVVVYIYDDMSEVSDLVEEAMRPLARKYSSTRFVKLHFQDAEMEPAGVPAVLAYRAGDKFAGLVPLVDEIPDDAELSAATLEKLFQRHQIL